MGQTFFGEQVEREEFFKWLDKNWEEVDFIYHIGARTDTTEFNKDVFDLLNLNYSKKVWNACCEYQIPLVYASSAATYGSGTLGYDDNEEIIPLLKPLIDVPRMATKGVDMLHRALTAFVNEDVEVAKSLPVDDDEVDALYNQIYRELMTFVIQDPKTIERANCGPYRSRASG